MTSKCKYELNNLLEVLSVEEAYHLSAVLAEHEAMEKMLESAMMPIDEGNDVKLRHWKDRVQAAEQRAEAAEAFKRWIHAWLDAEGVPHDPDPKHTAEHGCRISGRMTFLKQRMEAVEANYAGTCRTLDRIKHEREAAEAKVKALREALCEAFNVGVDPADDYYINDKIRTLLKQTADPGA